MSYAPFPSGKGYHMRSLSTRRELLAKLAAAGVASTFPLTNRLLADCVKLGAITVNNDYDGNVIVHLYHADAPTERYGTWRIGRGKTRLVGKDNQVLSIGGDWGIQVEFENGVLSSVNHVSKVGEYRGGAWEVKATTVYSTPSLKLNTGVIRFNNDYDTDIKVYLYHSADLQRRFAVYTIESGRKYILVYNNERLIVGGDWLIQVEFQNRSISGKPSIATVGRYIDGKWEIDASQVYEGKAKDFAGAWDENYRIIESSGFSISERFGDAQKRLLRKALVVFYDTFLQLHSIQIPEINTKAIASFSNLNRSDLEGVDPQHYLHAQLNCLRAHCIGDKPDVLLPYINIDYAKEDGANWVGRAPYGVLRVKRSGEGDEPFDGQFKVEINDYYLLNSALGKQYTDPLYYGGVLVHELLHNLGHSHPTGPNPRGDPDYYKYQMILVEMWVMSEGTAHYGDKIGTPVLCTRWPH